MANWLPSFKTLCVLCVVGAVSACVIPDGPIEIRTEIVAPEVPRENLVCPPVPTPPNPDTSTQRDVAVYLPEIISVAEHCHRDLGVVREVLDSASDLPE